MTAVKTGLNRRDFLRGTAWMGVAAVAARGRHALRPPCDDRAERREDHRQCPAARHYGRRSVAGPVRARTDNGPGQPQRRGVPQHGSYSDTLMACYAVRLLMRDLVAEIVKRKGIEPEIDMRG